MKVLAIGDVHGCYYTLRRLVELHWNPNEQMLIQLGDLINKGPHSGLCIKYWLELEEQYPEKTVLLRGNHEQMWMNQYAAFYRDKPMKKLMNNLKNADIDLEDLYQWLRTKPLKWETEGLLLTHAGISKFTDNPYDINNPLSVINNRGQTKLLKKTQIIGHNIVKGNKPLFNTKENTWYIDTGAWTKKYLSAISIRTNGNDAQIIRQERSWLDG